MKLERTFKQGEIFEDILPEILHAFSEHPEEESVELKDESGYWYRLTPFDIKVYQLLNTSELKDMFIGILFEYQSCITKNTPNFFVGEIMGYYNDLRLQERMKYNNELAKKYVSRKNSQKNNQ
ncbi:MAG: hypothetical protein J6A04_07315 [Clostridia bacterium]|nr:hypothetical protein [Clostridia bacterium]